jgi:hypothetical protein
MYHTYLTILDKNNPPTTPSMQGEFTKAGDGVN